jgi:hypothetical protein
MSSSSLIISIALKSETAELLSQAVRALSPTSPSALFGGEFFNVLFLDFVKVCF